MSAAGDGEVVVNGVRRRLGPGTTVAGLVAEVCPSPRGVAVAVGGEVVPRSAWDRTPVPPGAEVEIVTAAAGG